MLDGSPPAPEHGAFVSLRARLSGQSADQSLHHGVPFHLDPVLRQWLSDAENADLDDQPPLRVRVCLRLGIGPPPVSGRGGLAALFDADLLDVVDAVLYSCVPSVTLHGDLLEFPEGSHGEHQRQLLQRLDNILELGRSAYRVAESGRQLERRLDPTVTAAAKHTMAVTEPSTAALLRDAWDKAHGLHPDPTAAYRQAVRAVEQIICPLILPNDPHGTLGKVVGHLRQGGHKWRFTLMDKQGDDTIDPLIAMLDRLWTGQVSRHGGGRNSREQTHAEAEAAVSLAVAAVQLLSTGALSQRSIS